MAKKTYQPIKILSLDGSDIYRAMNRANGKRGISIKDKNGQLDTAKFRGFIDVSLDTEKIKSIYSNHKELPGHFNVCDGYTTSVISVSFEFAVKQYFNKGKQLFVKDGYDVTWEELEDHVCVIEVDGEKTLIAIEVAKDGKKGDKKYTPVEKPISEELRNAKRFIFLEFYTVSAGTVLSEILDILVEKAGLGVEVKILYDEIGSLFKIPEDFAKIMKRSKIEARFSSSLFAAFPKGVNNRNHRKIIVIDGEIAYTGGINLADEYVYSKRRLGKWKDAGVRIEGVGVTSLTHTFLSDFVFAGGECDSFSKYYKYRKKKSSGYSLIFDDGPYPIYDEKISERMILSLIDASEKSFILTSPYLIFSSRILSAVRGAVKRGVKVKIIIPAVPDKLLTAILTHRYADRLCEIGARVYMYLPGFLHSKIYSADGKFAMCGTVNLDYRSLRHNFENGILFLEHPVIADIDKDLESILKECAPYKVKKKNPIVRLIGALLEIFAPLF